MECAAFLSLPGGVIWRMSGFAPIVGSRYREPGGGRWADWAGAFLMHRDLRGVWCLWVLFSPLALVRAEEAAKPSSGPVDAAPATRPAGLTEDLTVWPNQVSFRNSDPWIWQNHEKIRKMRPRVMVLNFANDVEMPAIQQKTDKLIAALAEATRYHGYEDPSAPAFLEYQVVKYVDMRDRPVPPERAHRNSAFFPADPKGPKDFGCDYRTFYSDAFARFYGFQDPKNGRRYLNLHELINAGLVHELWFYAVHLYEEGWPANEVIEDKQYYDERCQPIPGKHGPAGNDHSDSFPWSGRSFRMAFFNPHRGTGCQMENFGHGLEGIANYDAIQYYTKYFREYAELDLNKRYQMPFDSLYRMPYDQHDVVSYPTPTKMKVKYEGKDYTIDPYVSMGGNVHFPPGGRHQYDLDSPATVKCRIENWRRRNGPDGKDVVLDFNKSKFARFNDVAPDCMGPWMVFWRQCMPGLDNKSLDDEGRRMKNWWVFLFY